MTTSRDASTDSNDGPLPRGAVRFSWRLSGARTLASDRPVLLGILNATPDSFSDGGELATLAAVVDRARSMASDGADALDVGGESTRPGAARVSEAEQIARTAPAIEAIRGAGITLPITIDTTRAAVARAALEAGADAINDVSGGTEDDEMLPLAASRGCGIILMHRLTTPERDSFSTEYMRAPDYPGGVVRAVRGALEELLGRAVRAGVAPGSVVVDPGIGFGKSVAQNGLLVHSAGVFNELGAGALVGASRKSFLSCGTVTRPAERDAASVGAAALALASGARFFRVHNVSDHRLALDALDACVPASEMSPDA